PRAPVFDNETGSVQISHNLFDMLFGQWNERFESRDLHAETAALLIEARRGKGQCRVVPQAQVKFRIADFCSIELGQLLHLFLIERAGHREIIHAEEIAVGIRFAFGGVLLKGVLKFPAVAEADLSAMGADWRIEEPAARLVPMMENDLVLL